MSENGYSHKKLADRFHHISENGICSIYLFTGESQAVLFDTGFGLYDLKKYVQTITDKPLTIFNTHGHYDHILGNYLFDKVIMHPEDIKIVDMPLKDEDADDIVREFCGGTVPAECDLQRWKEQKTPLVPIDRDVYEFGDFSVKVFHTPGHTRGQVAYLIEPDGYLVVGDTLVHGKPWCHLEESADMETYLATVETISSIAEKGIPVYSGHSAKPLPPRIVKAYPDFIRQVINGEVKGVIEHPFTGPGMAYSLRMPYGILTRVPLEENLLRFIRYTPATDPGRYDEKGWPLSGGYRSIAETVNSVLKHVYTLPAGQIEQEMQNIKSDKQKAADILELLFAEKESFADCINDNVREYVTCREFAVLLTSLLRIQGKAARSRAGFAAYIIEGRFIDHWITELYNFEDERWITIDSDRMRFDFDGNEFLNAGKVFLDALDGRLDLSLYGSQSGHGWIPVITCLLNDFYNLVHNELWYNPGTDIYNKLNWEQPDTYSSFTATLSAKEKKLLKDIAGLLCSPDKNLDKLISLYKNNRVVQVSE